MEARESIEALIEPPDATGIRVDSAEPRAELVRAWCDRGERLDVEFKSDKVKPLSDRDLVLAVVCLANGVGGVLLVGVEDDGTVTGARPRHESGVTDPARVQALIANMTQPPVPVRASVVGVDGGEVLAVQVPRSRRITGTSDGTYKRRAMAMDGTPECVPFHAHEMLAYEVDRGAVDWAQLPVAGASWDDLDPLEFERIRRQVRTAGAAADASLATLADRDIARALGLIPGDQITTGALLVFGREQALRRHVPTHEAAFQVLNDLRVEVNDFVRMPVLRLAEDFASRLHARNQEEELQLGLLRVGITTYSETAFREALANALVHRDYTRRAAVHVQMTSDRIEISSPGGLPPGIRLDNILVAAPRPRSQTLADVFKRAGLVERTGRGVNRMFMEQLRFGRPAPDYGRTSDDTVVAVLAGGPANLQLTRWLLEQESRGVPVLLESLQVVDELVRERSATTEDLSQVIQRTPQDTRHHLTRMVERGWVEARGERKGRTWHLSAALYRVLDDSAGYVRVRGFEPLQQEQMVLQYVAAHGSITRSQAAELCAISADQASRVLRRLVDRGGLVQHGERRWTRYVQP